jgi:hypothetical protein
MSSVIEGAWASLYLWINARVYAAFFYRFLQTTHKSLSYHFCSSYTSFSISLISCIRTITFASFSLFIRRLLSTYASRTVWSVQKIEYFTSEEKNYELPKSYKLFTRARVCVYVCVFTCVCVFVFVCLCFCVLDHAYVLVILTFGPNYCCGKTWHKEYVSTPL